MNTSDLKGLKVAITGGTSGLGLALTRALHARGASVAFVARTEGDVARVVRDLPGSHGIVGDVSLKDETHRIALQIAGELGGLDLLINNASSLGPIPLALLADTECEEFEAAIATNLLGPFRVTKALLGSLATSAREHTSAHRNAVVVNISSDAAITPYARWGAYASSKAALHHMSRIWDVELRAHGVRVMSIDPGDMDTPLHALAVPDADPATLNRPTDRALAIIDSVLEVIDNDMAARVADQEEAL